MKAAAAPSSLTAEQKVALSAHDRTVSLAAGAGCGKTFVLTERFLSYLDPRIMQPPAELHELVAITFTEAAAREMRERIRRRCYQLYQATQEPSERRNWQRLLRTLDGARISTIHSFCGTLLRNHAVEAEVDPRFEVLDAPAAELLRLQTLDDCLREMLQESDERILRLATRFKLNKLREYIADLMGTHLDPFLDRWREASAEDLIDRWSVFHRDQVVPMAVQALAHAPAVLSLKQQCREPGLKTPKFLERTEQILATLEQLEAGDTAAAGNLKDLAGVRGVCKASEWADQEQYQQYKSTCEQVRKLVDKSSLAQTLSEPASREVAEVGLELMQVVAEIADRYAAVKQAANVLEFDDLLIRSHRLLTDPKHRALQQRLAGSMRLLLVDEFQDTDPLQVSIVQALCGEDWRQRGLFVVGDHKQSIYRFRGAEPLVSSQLRSSLGEDSRLSLTTNFRSQPAVLDFVNALFEDTFTHGYEQLTASREQSSPTPAVEFLWSLGEEQEQEPAAPHLSAAQQSRAREARRIAQRLAHLIDSQEPLIAEKQDDGSEQLRPVRPGDVAILLRALSDVAIYEDALRQYGLDYYLAGGHAFYAQQEIYDVLNLMRAISSEADELSLAGALRSPIFACQDETLYWLVRNHGSLNVALQSGSPLPQLSSEEQSKVFRAASALQRLRDAKDHLLVAELLHLALELTGYDATLLCEFLGERKLANIHKLIDQARAIDRSRPGDLQGFITQLAELVVRDPKEPLATTAGEGDVIQIMTIHNAKGLEFPLVVLPDLERRKHTGEFKPVFDAALGPLVKSEDKKELVGYDLHQAIERAEDQEEMKRLLYVGCTRAADRLILSSSVDDLDKPKSPWMKLLAEKFDLDSGALNSSPEGPNLVEVIGEIPPLKRKNTTTARKGSFETAVQQAQELAEQGGGRVPETVAAIAPNLSALRRFSFSQLSGQLELEVADPVEESTQPSASLDPLRFGTLVHAVLERVDFRSAADVQPLCRYLAPLHMLDQWQAAADEAANLVRRFLESDRAEQLASAQVVKNEVEFLLPWPDAGDCYLHGYIDCLYQDAAGRWHLLDYKTNQVAADGVPKVAEKYAMQMFVYGLACQQALGVAPEKTVLHFLRPATEFAPTFTASSARAMTAEITRAIENSRTTTTQRTLPES